MPIQDSQLFNSAGITLASNSLKGVSEFLKLPIHGLSDVFIISSHVVFSFLNLSFIDDAMGRLSKGMTLGRL